MTATRAIIDFTKRRQTFQQRLLESVKKITAGDGVWGEMKTKGVRDTGEDTAIDANEPLGLAGYQAEYADGESAQKTIKYGEGESFVLLRFQSPECIRKAFDSVRNSKSSFKWFEGKNGQKGYFSSTKLGGNYVLAESEQLAVDCTTEEVLRAYLSGDLQTEWNTKDLEWCHFTKCKKDKKADEKEANRILRSKTTTNDSDDESEHDDNDYYYQQDLCLQSQRVITSHTGPMRYQQIIEIDKVGSGNYSALVRLFKNKKEKSEKNGNGAPTVTTTAKKPFESLQVYVGLEQVDKNVKIYAAGVFEVNREVVPKIIVFDTSGIAGALAGKGTLWLSGYFGQRQASKQMS